MNKNIKTFFSNEKNYNTLHNYNKITYNKKIIRIPLNAGFTCPNRDGKLGFGGCLYCSEKGSGDFTLHSKIDLKEQFKRQVETLSSKWPNAYYIAYFQANTNTYAPLEKLKEIYESVLDVSEKLMGISISTRPDCISPELINYLSELNKKIPISIELGLQSSNESTMDKLNRFQKNEDFINITKSLSDNNIEVIAHIINSLPGETEDDMINTIKFLNKLPIKGIKIHMLYIVSTSALGKIYLERPFKILSRDEFINITVNQLRHLRPDIIVHRITGDGVLEDLIEPKWTIKKFTVLNDIDKLMRKHKYFQGDLFLNK